MSMFSDLLKDFIEQKDIRVQALAKYCGVERSTLYKFINGRREPASPELVKKLALFMQLSPVETQSLENAWKASRMGEKNYYARKSIENFLRNFPHLPSADLSADVSLPSLEKDPNLPSGRDCIAFFSPQQVNSCVSQMLLAECQKTESRLRLFLQPDYDFLFHLLALLRPAGNMEISHILCLDTSHEFTKEHELSLLHYLRVLFPVYMERPHYDTRYFYDNLDAHFHNMNLFPCLILTSDAALVCASDCQSGIYYRSPSVVELLQSQFLSWFEQCSVLFDITQMRPDSFFSVMPKMYAFGEEPSPLIALEPEACLLPFLTADLLSELFNYDLPQADDILTMADSAFGINRQRLRDKCLTIYFTDEGLSYFAQTGRILEVPEAFYHPLNAAQRVQVLGRLLDCCLDGSYRMLQPPLNHLPYNLHLFVSGLDTGGIYYIDSDKRTLLLSVREARTLAVFRDYLENMEETSFYPKQEAADKIQNIINRLKKEIS